MSKKIEWRVLSEGFDAALTPFFSYYPAYVSFADSLGAGEKNSLVLFEGTHFWQAFDPVCFNAVGAEALRRFASDEEFCGRVNANHAEGVRRMTAVAEKALAAARRVGDAGDAGGAGGEGVSNEEAAALVEEFDEAFYYAAMWGTVISAIEYGESQLAHELVTYLARVAPGRNANELLEALSYHEEKTFIQQARAKLLALLDEFKAGGVESLFSEPQPQIALEKLAARHPFLARKLREHAREWAWIAYSYTGPALDEEYFFAALKDAFGRGETLAALEEKNAEALAKRKELERSLFPLIDDGHARLFRIARIQPFLKAKRNEAMYYCDYAFDELLQAFSKQTGVGVHELRFLLPSELIEALRAGCVDKNLIARRTKAVVVVWVDGVFSICDGGEALEFKKKLAFPKSEGVGELRRELRGICASKGKARGRVSIILSLADFGKFRDGDVLVSVGTSPGMVPLMKRAAAIVTDVGGLTCHAAIVSRELGVPCVVATKAATKTLRDGDFVEVDASNGVVRVIRKIS